MSAQWQEGISFLMLAVNAAGAGYSINQYIAPAHKMQIISDKYNEAFMDNLYQSIKNVTPDQFRSGQPLWIKQLPVQILR